MKVLIVSDIHGNFSSMKKVIEDNPSFDYLLLLGDILAGPYIEGYNPEELANLLNQYKNKIITVKGNCDYDTELLEFSVDKLYITVPIDNKLFLMTHGHYYNSSSLPDVPFDVLLTGHSHIPLLVKENNKLYVNPGSITLPRGDSVKSYIYYDNGSFMLKDLEKNKNIKKIVI